MVLLSPPSSPVPMMLLFGGSGSDRPQGGVHRHRRDDGLAFPRSSGCFAEVADDAATPPSSSASVIWSTYGSVLGTFFAELPGRRALSTGVSLGYQVGAVLVGARC